MEPSRYLAARLLRVLLTLLGVVALTFVLGRVTGDPVALMIPQNASPEDAALLRQQLGIDRPILEQFFSYLGGLFRGDLGTSIVSNRPALELVLERIPLTLQLGLPALLLATLVGIGAGVVAAIRRDSLADRAVRMVSLSLLSLPSFVVGIGLILLFGVALKLLPTFGSDSWRHMILPVFTLALAPAALLARLTRSSLLEVLSSDYIRTARSKGLAERLVVYRHGLRNALIPVVTILGLELAGIIGGAVIVETVFAWPGLGLLAVEAIGGRDFPVIQAIVVLTAASFALINLLTDLSYAVLDPRLRRAG